MSFPVIFDDAAIFPPGNLALIEAVLAHRRHRAGAYADLVGPLVVGMADLRQLADEGPLEVAVVVPDAAGAVEAIEATRSLAGIRIVALEVKDATVAALREAIGEPTGFTVYVEVPRDDCRSGLIHDLAGSSYRAKLRTGGLQQEMYPDELELAAALLAVTAAGVRFKATAGLHHAIRNTDHETGLEQHGFLNLVAATARAEAGASLHEVADVLAERDPYRLPSLPQHSSLDSIGTCVITEPVEELRALGLIAASVTAS